MRQINLMRKMFPQMSPHMAGYSSAQTLVIVRVRYRVDDSATFIIRRIISKVRIQTRGLG